MTMMGQEKQEQNTAERGTARKQPVRGVPGYPQPPVQEDELIYRSPQSEQKKAEQRYAPKPEPQPEPPKKPRIAPDGLLYSGPVSQNPEPVRPARQEPPRQPQKPVPQDGLLYRAPAAPVQPERPVMQQQPPQPRQEPIPQPVREPVRREPAREPRQSVREPRQPVRERAPQPVRERAPEPVRRRRPEPQPERPRQNPRRPAAEQTPPPRKPRREQAEYLDYDELDKPQKKPLWKRVLAAVLVLLLLLAGGIALAANHVLDKFGSFDETLPPRDGEIQGQADDAYAGVPELTIEDSVNIMLIGADASPDGVRSRSDTMILVTLNPRRNAIQMTSFMRDTYVHIPGYEDNRLNAAYRFGDIELMNETIRKNFGVSVDGNVMVDFTKFAEIIDLLGGVDVELSREEANYMITEGCMLEPGRNHLSGADALTFVRMRYVSGGDYGRTERQRRVLSQLIATFRDADLRTLMNLVDQVLPSVTTNIPKLDIIKYATNGLALLSQGATIETLQIPAYDAHRADMISGMSVLVPDLEMCQEDLREFFAPKITLPAESTKPTE